MPEKSLSSSWSVRLPHDHVDYLTQLAADQRPPISTSTLLQLSVELLVTQLKAFGYGRVHAAAQEKVLLCLPPSVCVPKKELSKINGRGRKRKVPRGRRKGKRPPGGNP